MCSVFKVLVEPSSTVPVVCTTDIAGPPRFWTGPLSASPFGTLPRVKKSTHKIGFSRKKMFHLFSWSRVRARFSRAAKRVPSVGSQKSCQHFPALALRSAGEQDVIECQYHCVILCMMTKQTGEGRWARCPRGRLKISSKTEISHRSNAGSGRKRRVWPLLRPKSAGSRPWRS